METRIKEIRVTGLFGMFDHVISLNQDGHLTIVYGENGIGKTMIFRILEALFALEFLKLYSLPFGQFEVEFDNESWIRISKGEDLEFEGSMFEGKKHIAGNQLDGKGTDRLVEKLQHSPSELHRIVRELYHWMEHPKNRKLASVRDKGKFFPRTLLERIETSRMGIQENGHLLNEIIRSYPEFIAEEFSEFGINCPQELSAVLQLYKVTTIDTHRLFVDSTDFEVEFELVEFQRKSSERKGRNSRIHSVVEYSRELAFLIRKNQIDYQKKTEQLENSLRQRLTSQEVKVKMSDNEFRELSNQVKKRKLELSEVGLIDDLEDETEAADFSKMEDIAKAIIGVNLLDMQTKLTVFDDIYLKLKLFLDIINERRFSYKSLSIDQEKGFIFTNANDEIISLKDLSSGEQHELILLYQLLFKVPKGALILIDEPEISLHVAWQKAFIDDMTEIIKLRGFDLLVATHSPSIINGRWDITVSLTGKEKVHG